MKKINLMVIGMAAFVGGVSAQAAGWTNNLTIDRIAPRYDSDKIYLVVKGSNYLNTCESNGANYVELKISSDPGKLVYTTLLSLYTTGKQALFYIDTGCNVKYVESCGASTCSVF